MSEESSAICIVCKKSIINQELKFSNGFTFHSSCFNEQGSKYSELDYNLINQALAAKGELEQLKEQLLSLKSLITRPKRSSTKKTKKKPIKKTTTKKVKKIVKRKATKKRTTVKKKTAKGRMTKLKRKPSRQR